MEHCNFIPEPVNEEMNTDSNTLNNPTLNNPSIEPIIRTAIIPINIL